jgi:hypothetical protein
MANENALPFDPGKVPDLIKQGKIKVVSTPNLPRPEALGRIHEISGFSEARGIMGNDFFGPDEIKNALGYDLDKDSIPNIPFSKEELERAKANGEFLIFYASDTIHHQPITMQRLNLHSKPATTPGIGKVLYDTTWYKDEAFFTTETPRSAWKLVTKEVIPGSTSHNYLQQTDDIANYASVNIDNVNLPAGYWGAVGELTAQHHEIEDLMSSDWQEAAKRLAALQINQMFRQTPVEALYADMVYFQNKQERLLETMYAWTNTQTSDGGLVLVGLAAAEGVYVLRWLPDDSPGTIGVVLSR